MGMYFRRSAAPPPDRPADPAVRRANLRRIGRLFVSYRLRLGGVLVLIVGSAALGVIPAFLLKRVLEAIERNDTRSLSLNAGGMIVIAIITGALGVIQTLLSNQVGQRVMHDLRAAVFRHLQRLSLAFFTRTRTGEVQSRISNDIGGVQNVVTNTATSIASNVTTVVATMVASAIEIDWAHVFPGALVTALLFSAGKYFLGLYLGRASVASPYGAAGSVGVLVIWVYYAAQILLLGAEFTRVYALARGAQIVPSKNAIEVPPAHALCAHTATAEHPAGARP
jgi:ABC-type multidrug transport system fused ATPase/permease subunit